MIKINHRNLYSNIGFWKTYIKFSWKWDSQEIHGLPFSLRGTTSGGTLQLILSSLKLIVKKDHIYNFFDQLRIEPKYTSFKAKIFTIQEVQLKI